MRVGLFLELIMRGGWIHVMSILSDIRMLFEIQRVGVATIPIWLYIRMHTHVYMSQVVISTTHICVHVHRHPHVYIIFSYIW